MEKCHQNSCIYYKFRNSPKHVSLCGSPSLISMLVKPGVTLSFLPTCPPSSRCNVASLTDRSDQGKMNGSGGPGMIVMHCL